MKTILSILFLGVCAATNTGCEVYAQDSFYTASPISYQVNSLYSEGVDDRGSMWFGVSGSFDSYGNDVQADCDGRPVEIRIENQSPTLIEISTPAVNQYRSCNFSVYVQGQVIGVISMTDVNAMEIFDASTYSDPNPSRVEVTLQGIFFVQPLNFSTLSVVADCNGGPLFSPRMIYTSGGSITVQVANPGYHFSEVCHFQVQDTLVDRYGNQVMVSSPEYAATIFGM